MRNPQGLLRRLLGCLLCHVLLVGVSTPASAEQPADPQIFNFQTRLPTWSGKLQPEQKQSVSLDLDPICDLSIQLDQENPEPTKSEITFSLGTGDRFVVQIQTDPKTSENNFILISSQTGFFFKKTNPLQRTPWNGKALSGAWNVHFRFGGIVIEGPQGLTSATFIPSPLDDQMTSNPQAVVGIEFRQKLGTVSLDHVKIRGRKARSISGQFGKALQLASKAATMKVELMQGRIQQSLQTAQAAEKLAGQVYEPFYPEVASAVAHQAMCYLFLKQIERAEQAYRRATESCVCTLGFNHPHTLLMSVNLATCLSQQGRKREAKNLLRLADASARSLGSPVEMLAYQVRNNLAASYRDSGELAKADSLFKECHEYYLAQQKTDREFAYLLSNLSITQFELLLRRGADDPTASLTQIVDNLEHVTNLLSQPQANRKNAGIAEVLATRALSINAGPTDALQAKSNQAAVLMNIGKIAEAQELLAEIEDSEEHQSEIQNHIGILQLIAQDPAGAVASFQKSESLLQKQFGLEHPNSLIAAINLGFAHLANADVAAAEKTWQDAADRLPSTAQLIGATGWERAPFVASINPLMHLAALQAQQNQFEKAWETWERSLSQGLSADLAAQATDPQNARFRGQLLDQIRVFEKQLATADPTNPINPQVQASLQVALQELNRLDTTSSQWFNESVPFEELIKTIPEGTALVAWLDVKLLPFAANSLDAHWAIVLQRNRPAMWIPLPIDHKVRLAELSVRNDLQTRSTHNLKANIDLIRKARWQPIADKLHTDRNSRVERLVAVSSPALAGLPIELLVGDNYSVNYVPSCTVYQKLLTRRSLRKSTSDQVLIIAPKTTSNDRQLVASREFLANTERIFAPTKRRVLQDDQATSSQLRTLLDAGDLRKFRILHFDTHGEAGASPFSSRLELFSPTSKDAQLQTASRLLAGTSLDSNELTAAEVLTTWQLNADCVVLSACETATETDFWKSEGYLGFAYAFLAAGSDSLIVTRWRVPDLAAALVCSRFYENLLGNHDEERKVAGRSYLAQQPMGVAHALHEAKVWLRELTDEEIRHQPLAQRYAAHESFDITDDDEWYRFRQSYLAKTSLRAFGVDRSQKPTEAPRALNQKLFSHPSVWTAFFMVGVSN